ncbi:MAG TPA: MerR family transcriptional regulator [Bacillales bacterium]|nr:MerR family transcriptional regulator [Bacillales bacterium]
MAYKVKEVAELAGVSIRTLHHYDRIGLLKPDSVSASGYRLYSEADLEKLQQILFFKEIGFSLRDIQDIVARPDFDRMHALKAHKELLVKKKKRLEGIIATVEKTMATLEGGTKMSENEMFDGLDRAEIKKYQEDYAEEAREKYGKEIVDRTLKKTAQYTKEDWAAIQAKQRATWQKIADGMEKGASDPEVQEAVGDWRKQITDNYYECTLEIFRGLGDLYVNDERFKANYEKIKPGLAAFMREAIHFYCDSHKK